MLIIKTPKSDFEHSEKPYSSSKLENYQLVRDKERRIIKMPQKYGIANLISYILMVVDEVIDEEPKSYK